MKYALRVKYAAGAWDSVGAIHESPAHGRSFRIVSGPFVNGPYGAGSQSGG